MCKSKQHVEKSGELMERRGRLRITGNMKGTHKYTLPKNAGGNFDGDDEKVAVNREEERARARYLEPTLTAILNFQVIMARTKCVNELCTGGIDETAHRQRYTFVKDDGGDNKVTDDDN